MKEIFLFSSGGFAGMAILMIWNIVRELRAFAIEDIAEMAELRDNHKVSCCIAGDKYYD